MSEHTNTNGDFQIVAWIVETKLNGIKYLYAGQFMQIFATVGHAFDIDFNERKNVELVFWSVKKAIEIYFVPEDYTVDDLVTTSMKDWWTNFNPNDVWASWIEPNVWKKVGCFAYGYKDENTFKEGILFHIKYRLAIEN